MERNYSMMLKQLQMAFMPITMKNQVEEDETCLYCWKSNCGCNSHTTPQNDSFITLTTVSEFNYV